MSTVITKPPWTRIEWYPQAKQLKEYDASGCPVLGEWVEERNEMIEELKENIQPFDKTELWDLAKRITNPYELINTHSSRLSLPKSICCIYPLSRSFFKMIEMMYHLQFFERHKIVKLRSLHICEGPGGFVEAFHYLADEKKRIIQQSYGMTLKSTHTMIPGWRRASSFLQKHKNIQLLFGPTRTGNIYEPCNQDDCVQSVGMNGAHLVTSDGGFDFSEDFHAQEKTILRLLVCSALILIRSVAVEGDIILKLFDCNSPFTRDIITILASCFSHWTLYKPVTSRPCNSEWYFLGKSAVRTRTTAIQLLTTIRDGLSQEPPIQYTRILKQNTLEDFLRNLQVQRCEKQKQSLEHVLDFCHTKDTVSFDKLWNQQKKACVDWCVAFHMPYVLH